MPFLNSDLLRYQIGLAVDFDAVILRIGGKVEPLHAVYSKSCLPSIEQLLRGKTLAIAQLFSMVKTRYVDKEEIRQYDPECLSVFNVNTNEDLERARELVGQMESCAND
jgi:molybdopterin-guanine dinucleotide biosynthesis protein A